VSPRPQDGAQLALSFAGFAYATVLTIAVTPIVLHRIGAEAYGVLPLTGTFLKRRRTGRGSRRRRS
jgi:hypothetical protein